MIVHWAQNLFKVPSGNIGNVEMARLFHSYVNSSSLESIALKAVLLFLPLLLQKSHRHLKTSDHISHLQRRLELWKNGSFDVLLKEGIAIKKQLVIDDGTNHSQI